MLAAVILPLGG